MIKRSTSILLFTLSVATSFVKAQQVSIQSMSSAGTHSTIGSLQLEGSLGEFASPSISNGSILITQGFVQPYEQLQGPLPVLGLEFNAKRISNNKVQLDWKTIQEMNNLGFHIERKKENENNFASLDFVKSKAFDGNSSLPLQYAAVDMNDFTGMTYYRLKQTDIDGKFIYSIICRVSGEASKSITLKAWPIPSYGDLTVMAEGIDKDVLQVFDAAGRLVRQIPLTNATQEKVNRLSPGTYIIRLAGQKDIVQKVLVQ